MAYRFHEFVREGEVDGTVRGRVAATIWFEGLEKPMRLQLEGVGWPDVAGRRVTFRNPAPKRFDDPVVPPMQQRGRLGDFTASRKVRVPDVPIEEFVQWPKDKGRPPTHWANSLYLEWYAEWGARFVIESADYQIEMSDAAWEPTREELERQARGSAEGMERFLQQGVEALAAEPEGAADGDEGPEFAEDNPMDEFAWERFMKDSDRRNDKYQALREKYEDDPDREEKVAREMGWTWLLEALEEQRETGEREPPEPAWLDEETLRAVAEAQEETPDPTREGIDWVRGAHGDIVHPLYDRASRVVNTFWEACRDRGLVRWKEHPDGDPAVDDLLFTAHTVTAKLAGALNSIADRTYVDHGFVVAYLKRAMKYLNDSLGKLGDVRAKGVLEPELLDGFERDLCAVRQSMHDLMEEHRRAL